MWLYRCFQQTIVSEISCKNICCNLSIWVSRVFLLPSKIKEELIWCMKGMLVLNQLFIILSRPVWERKCIGLTAVWFSSASTELWSSSSYWKKGSHLSHRISFLALLVKGWRTTGHFCLQLTFWCSYALSVLLNEVWSILKECKGFATAINIFK